MNKKQKIVNGRASGVMVHSHYKLKPWIVIGV